MYKEACNLSSTTNSSGDTTIEQKTSNGYIITSTYDTSGNLTGYTEKRTTSSGTVVAYEYTVSNGTKSLFQVTSTYADGSKRISAYENGSLSSSEKTDASGKTVSLSNDLPSVLKQKYGLTDDEIEYVCEKLENNTSTVSRDSIISYDVTTNKTGIDKILAKYIDSDGNVIGYEENETENESETEETSTANEVNGNSETIESVIETEGTNTTTTYDESESIISVENNNSSGELQTVYYTLKTILQLKYPQLSSSEIADICEKITSNSHNITASSQISYDYSSNKTGIDKIIAKYVNEDSSIIEN